MHSGAPDEPAPKRCKSDATEEHAPSLTQARQMWLVPPTPSSLQETRQMIVEACGEMRQSLCLAITAGRKIKHECNKLADLLVAHQGMVSEEVKQCVEDVKECVEDLGGMGAFGATQRMEMHATDVLEETAKIKCIVRDIYAVPTPSRAVPKITLTVRESTQTVQETTQTIQE